jgi:hypothetical protein
MRDAITNTPGTQTPDPSMNTKITALLAMFLTSLCPALADLQWEHKDQTITLGVNQPHTKLMFPFTNTGSQSVAILSVVPSCTCLKIFPIEEEIQPGATGMLEVQYLRTNRTGPLNYRITVQTTDPQNPTVELMVRVAGTDNYTIVPGRLHWIMGAQAGTKEVLFKDVKNSGLKPTSAFCTDPNFTVEIKPVNDKGAYPIAVTAFSTEKAAAGFVHIDVTAEDGTVEKTRIIAAVRDPDSSRIIVR